MKRCILHVDMDAFYAAVEVRENPSLQGKPVIVGASPTGRGVVSTCSYEARQYGLRSGMSIKEAYARCPHGVYIRPDFKKYRAVSAKIHHILASYTDQIEFVALDEGYLDITGSLNLFGGAEIIGQKIKTQIWEETSLTCSVGIGYNMMSAKLASEERKPNGFFIIPTTQALQKLIIHRPIRVVPGIGRKTATLLTQHGVDTVEDLQKWNIHGLQKLFGQKGLDLYHLSRGIDHRVVTPDAPPKSFGKEMTFQQDLTVTEDIENVLKVLARKLSILIHKQGYWCSTITLKIKYNTFQLVTRSHTLDHPTRDAMDIYRIACFLLQKIDFHHPIRLVGLSLSHLTTTYTHQLTLEHAFGFGNDTTSKQEQLQAVLLQLYHKYDENIIQTASEMEAKTKLPE